MEVTHAIIAYRNPFEMWLWESGAIWIWVFVVSSIFCYLGFNMISRILKNHKR